MYAIYSNEPPSPMMAVAFIHNEYIELIKCNPTTNKYKK